MFHQMSVCDFEEMQKAVQEMAVVMAQCEMVHGKEYDRVSKNIDDVSYVIRIPEQTVVRTPEVENYGYDIKEGHFKSYIAAISFSTSYFVVENEGSFYVVIDH